MKEGITMRFFEQYVLGEKSDFFNQPPTVFTKNSSKTILRYCVGAALYMPAIRETIAQEIINSKHVSCTSIVLDLEDALGDLQVEQGEQQLIITLMQLKKAVEDRNLLIEKLPLLFVRVRSTSQLEVIIEKLGPLQHLLTGYVLPKFSMHDGENYLKQVVVQNAKGYTLYVMPILESLEILNKETRLEELLAIRKLLEHYESIVLNVRIGTTDFCGALGLRRTITTPVYEIISIQDCLADIMNVFLRGNSPFVLSGPVWEYFGNEAAIQGLVKETQYDCLNGLIGKTVIHPSHLEHVQATYIVTYEDYLDASRIVSNAGGEIGVEKSKYNNKMNEIKPHFIWAEKILLRAKAYGVLKEGYSVQQLLEKKVDL